MEKIGSVKLDYSQYHGEDLYCDGTIEDELLEIVKKKSPAEYAGIIESRKNWPILYHLSPQRENIIDWVPMEKGEAAKGASAENPAPEKRAASGMVCAGRDVRGREDAGTGKGGKTEDGAASGDGSAAGHAASACPRPGTKVLEVGSGCGGITGVLSRKAGSVTCVELSKKRSLINAYRHRDCDNITIHVGNFKDIEPGLPKDFDYICLIGVFEYGQSYIGGDTPYEDFLKMLMPHLAEGGRIIIAIENKYGLKYFAGCQEDHLGTYFSGIENYPCGGGVRTFSRNRLERIFADCGVEEYHFYYPYPDYKFMTKLYSDDYQPGRGELSDNLRNFDRERMIVFDEKSAFDGLAEDGLFPVFANSYLVVIGKGFDIKFVKYSNERAPEYAVKTQILDSHGMAGVRKYPMTQAAREHVRGMAAAYGSLRERYKGSNLEINKCRLVEEGDMVYAQFEFVPGIPLTVLMDKCLEKNDLEGFYKYVREYVKRLGYNSKFPAADFDPIFSNILVDGDKWTLIDYEWTFGKPIETKELAYRAICCYLQEDKRREKCKPDYLWRELSISEAEAENFIKQEKEFQSFVTGDVVSLAEIRERIDNRIFLPRKTVEYFHDTHRDLEHVQIYEDKGGGYQESTSYYIRDAYRGEDRLEMEFKVGADVQMIRIDPAFSPCMVKLQEVRWNGEKVSTQKSRFLYANGIIVKPDRKSREKDSVILFLTGDPNINLAVKRLRRRPDNMLYVRMEIKLLPLSMADGYKGKKDEVVWIRLLQETLMTKESI